MHTIPKIVHMTWPDPTVVDCDHPLILNGLRNLIDLNPQWTVSISTDDEVDNYLQKTLDKDDYLLIADKQIVAKSDVWRLLKLYFEGGLYVDMDRLCNQSLDSVINPNTKCVLPILNNWDFCQDVMLSAPLNPLYLKTLQMHFQRRRQGNTNVYFLGAQTYMHAITESVMGQLINTDPGEQIFNQIRQSLKSFDFVQTCQDNPPLDTFLYQHNPSTWRGLECPQVPEDWEKLKKSLYKIYNLTHWTGEW